MFYLKTVSVSPNIPTINMFVRVFVEIDSFLEFCNLFHGT